MHLVKQDVLNGFKTWMAQTPRRQRSGPAFHRWYHHRSQGANDSARRSRDEAFRFWELPSSGALDQPPRFSGQPKVGGGVRDQSVHPEAMSPLTPEQLDAVLQHIAWLTSQYPPGSDDAPKSQAGGSGTLVEHWRRLTEGSPPGAENVAHRERSLTAAGQDDEDDGEAVSARLRLISEDGETSRLYGALRDRGLKHGDACEAMRLAGRPQAKDARQGLKRAYKRRRLGTDRTINGQLALDSFARGDTRSAGYHFKQMNRSGLDRVFSSIAGVPGLRTFTDAETASFEQRFGCKPVRIV